MPDHVHLLVEGTLTAGNLSDFVKDAKQRSGYHGRRFCGVRVWQPGYFERVLRDSETTHELIAYIVENPVRAQLVGDPGDYPFIGSSRYTVEQLLEFVQVRPT
jgi:putative transposase